MPKCGTPFPLNLASVHLHTSIEVDVTVALQVFLWGSRAGAMGAFAVLFIYTPEVRLGLAMTDLADAGVTSEAPWSMGLSRPGDHLQSKTLNPKKP